MHPHFKASKMYIYNPRTGDSLCLNAAVQRSLRRVQDSLAAHPRSESRRLSSVVSGSTVSDAPPLLLQVVRRTLNALLQSWTCACGAGDVARAALHFFQVKKRSIGTIWNAGHSCQTESIFTGRASVCISQAFQTVLVTLQTTFLAIVVEVTAGTRLHTGALLRVEVKSSPAGAALVRPASHTLLTASVTAATSAALSVLKITQRTVTNTRPAGLEAAQTEVNTVEAVIGVRSITALISTFRMTRTIIFLLFLLFMLRGSWHSIGVFQLLACCGSLQHPGARVLGTLGMVRVLSRAVKD